ncbi:zinc-binding dehydrogenase [Nocardia sp. alder85J]|uniref:zinc-binding dehydrogenase n=1 Tax=Nocardia sp. alder85J TaxID=2862949 RepID=UPI001CD694DF|nr:zinc-binding dehydrogenase [Nocardia sp. alder85J]MCX4093881.1 zinc-binding dehydrogenase [Nocardia sp. alder85J]
MRAIVVDPAAASGVGFAEAPEPEPGPGQVLIDVRHTSLNSAEPFLAGVLEPGTVLGFDATGIVVAAAADGSGPPVGSRVVSYADHGGWARLRAVDSIDVAVVPDSIELGVAATLPVAAGTALRALRQAGPVAGLRVLVTGASGGVGTFAVQLAKISGAHVIASVGAVERGAGLRELGADEVVVGLDDIDRPVDLVIDQVGGSALVRAYALLAEGGSVQSVGWASGQAAVFPVASTLGRRQPISLVSVYNGGGLTDRGKHFRILLDLMEAGRLRPAIGWRGSWERVGEAVSALAGRTLAGKAVLDLG